MQLDPKVDAIHQWPGQLPQIPSLDRRGADAVTWFGRGTRTRIRRQNQLEPGWKHGSLVRPGDDDVATFQRLAKCVEHVTGELRRFIHEQHTTVRQRHRARANAP